jgi:hypothetical protein
MAIHSVWSSGVNWSESRVLCRVAIALCRISRHGLTHCADKARKIGDQYAAHASLRSKWDCCIKSGMRFVRCKTMLMAFTPLLTIGDSLERLMSSRGGITCKKTYCGLVCFGALPPRRAASFVCSCNDPILAADAKSFASSMADS